MGTNLKRFLKAILLLTMSFPFAGTGAINRDYLQPMFRFEHQSMEKYVINQMYFPTNFIRHEDFNKSVDFVYNHEPQKPEVQKHGLSYEDMLKLTTNIAPTNDQGIVSKIIVDNAMKMFVNSELTQSIDLVKTVKSVENAMNTDIKIRSEDGQISHEFSFHLMALQNSAKLLYKGYFDSELSYRDLNSETLFILNKKITNVHAVGFNHINNIFEVKDMVTVSWNF